MKPVMVGGVLLPWAPWSGMKPVMVVRGCSSPVHAGVENIRSETRPSVSCIVSGQG